MPVISQRARRSRRTRTDDFRSAYAAAGVAIARLTPGAVIIDANPHFAALVRRPVESLAGVELLDLLHPEDAAAMRAGRLSSFVAGAIHAELRILAGDEVVWGRATISVARQPGDTPDALVLTIEDLTAAKRREAELERRGFLDPDTGLPNAAQLARRLADAIRAARRGNRRLALLMIEFDRSGAVGEEAGAGAAAELLDQLTRRLQDQVRTRDFVARTGGNEFGIILAEVNEKELAEGVGRRLLVGLEPHFRLAGADVQVAVSMGVAVFPDHGRNPDAIIRRARRDMYGGTGDVAGEAVEEITDELEQRVALLEPVSLFLSVPDQVLRRIARYMSAQTAAAGEELAGPNGPPALRIIEEGLCEVRTPEELTLLTLGPGDFIGADSLLVEDPLRVQIRALTACKLLVLDADVVDRVAPAGTAFREALRAAAGQRGADQPRPFAPAAERDGPSGKSPRERRRVVDLEPELRQPATVAQRIRDAHPVADMAVQRADGVARLEIGQPEPDQDVRTTDDQDRKVEKVEEEGQGGRERGDDEDDRDDEQLELADHRPCSSAMTLGRSTSCWSGCWPSRC